MQSIAKEAVRSDGALHGDLRDMTQVSYARTHRVGSITAGVSLVVFGIAFLIRMFTDAITYEMVFSLWPLILIGLGAEILISNVKADNLKYDKGAAVLMILMMIFASCMACASTVMNNIAAGKL